ARQRCRLLAHGRYASMDPLPYHFIALHRLAQSADEFEIIHFHTDYLHFPLFVRHWGKTLTTLHGRLDLPDLPPMLREFAMMPLVSISNTQRMPVPWANWYGTVYHGLPSNLYAGGGGGGGYPPSHRCLWSEEGTALGI